jgi:hypothetical protein
METQQCERINRTIDEFASEHPFLVYTGTPAIIATARREGFIGGRIDPICRFTAMRVADPAAFPWDTTIVLATRLALAGIVYDAREFPFWYDCVDASVITAYEVPVNDTTIAR